MKPTRKPSIVKTKKPTKRYDTFRDYAFFVLTEIVVVLLSPPLFKLCLLLYPPKKNRITTRPSAKL